MRIFLPFARASAGVKTALNIENLPDGILYNTAAADADCNGDAKITLYVGEWEDANDESFTAASFGANMAYQFLRWVRTVVVKSEYHSFLGVPINLAVIEAMPGGPFENDLLVTVPSGQGVRSFEKLVRSQDRFPTFYCKNHASVCDEDVAARVGPWIGQVEREHGDLRP